MSGEKKEKKRIRPGHIALLIILIVILAFFASNGFGLGAGAFGIGRQAESGDAQESGEALEPAAPAEEQESTEEADTGQTDPDGLDQVPGDGGDLSITVKGEEIYFGGVSYKDAEELSEALKDYEYEEREFYLIDDYAIASSYSAVKDKLDELRIKYEEKKEE